MTAISLLIFIPIQTAVVTLISHTIPEPQTTGHVYRLHSIAKWSFAYYKTVLLSPKPKLLSALQKPHRFCQE